jgi:hypothetical protein
MLEERNSLLFRAKGKGGTHPELTGKGEGKGESSGKREFLG